MFKIYIGFFHLVQELWFENLKCINFNECDSITNLHDLCAPNIEEVDLSYCKNLVEVDESFGFLEKLKEWHLTHCKKFLILPSKLMLKSLKYFNLEGCSSFEKFPNIHPFMKCLEVLELSRSGIRGLPSSIGYLIALRTLYLYDCPNLSHLPDVIYKLQSTSSILANNSPNCSFWYGFSRLEALNLMPSHKLYLSRWNSQKHFSKNWDLEPSFPSFKIHKVL